MARPVMDDEEIWEFAPGAFCLRTDYPETADAPLWVYVLRGEQTLMCDAATSTSYDAILKRSFARLGWTAADIDWLLITHGHPDHTGAARALRADGSTCRVAAPLDDVPWIESFDRQWREFWEDLPGAVDVDPVRQVFLDQSGGDLQVDLILRDGDTLDLGDRSMRAVFTRGHTRGHSAYFDESAGILLTGDIGLGRSIGTISGTSNYPALYVDVDDHLAGLYRLRELPFEWLCPAHVRPLPRAHGLALIDEAIALVDEVEAIVADAISSGPISLRSVATVLGEHFGMNPPVWAHTAFVARAHLSRLARKGLAEPWWSPVG
jgi:glyoxylase-like metal-dependent hydrolase (beta-lactamase superfamily II)